MSYYFLKHLRPITARPTKPDPKSTIEMGSGTVELLSLPEVSLLTSVFVTAIVAGTSDQSQPTIPKNIIKIHKILNIFFK
jgi:hypothetical protein